MSTGEPVSMVGEIGEAAGLVWRLLSEGGPTTLAKLVKTSGQPRDTVMQAVGWLAREDKIAIVEEKRSRIVSLR